MRIINVTPKMDALLLGKQGENKSTKFLFDVSGWLEDYPGCTIGLNYRPAKSNVSYPCVLTNEDEGIKGWLITSSELVNDGDGEAELVCILDEVVEKDKRTWKTKVMKSLGGGGTAPGPWANWENTFTELVERAEDAAENAEAAAEALIDDTSTAQNRTWSADKLHDEIGGKADKSDTVLSTTLSRGRKSGSTVGTGSFAFGEDVVASGNYSHAEGKKTTTGTGAQMQTHYTTASGVGSHAEGLGTTASSEAAHAEGAATTASGLDSHAEGAQTTASGGQSHAEGFKTKASSNQAHAEGNSTTASGAYSHAEGRGTTASGSSSHASGDYTTASGSNSHAEGYRTTANHKSQHVFGEYNVSDSSENAASERGDYVEIVGNGEYVNGAASYSNARTLDWDGNEELAGDLTVNKGTENEVSVSSLKTEITKGEILEKLKADDIPGTTQTITFDQQTGEISQITHTANNTAVRTDVFTFGEGTITEVRTLSTGQSLTIVTNTTTLVTTITYADAA